MRPMDALLLPKRHMEALLLLFKRPPIEALLLLPKRHMEAPLLLSRHMRLEDPKLPMLPFLDMLEGGAAIFDRMRLFLSSLRVVTGAGADDPWPPPILAAGESNDRLRLLLPAPGVERPLAFFNRLCSFLCVSWRSLKLMVVMVVVR
jgi:hypothetical protein